jgi:C4-type Zn-finger protein
MNLGKAVDDESNTKWDPKKEAISFPTDCYACTAPGECKMCVVTIPYFKEIIIMAYSCD